MIIIGIAGGSGSGKTTVVKRISKALPPHCVAVVPLDSYYNDTTDLTPEERKQINFDHPDAFDWKLLTEQIKKLKNGEAIEQPTYSYVISNRLPETIHVEPKPVIILEGIMTLHYKKLRDMMDLKIFVDTDSDVRLIRNIRRDVVERGRTVDMVLDHYENDVKPMHEQFIEPTKKFADLIIPWGRENKRGIDILRTYIQGFSEEVKQEMKQKKRIPSQLGGDSFFYSSVCTIACSSSTGVASRVTSSFTSSATGISCASRSLRLSEWNFRALISSVTP